MVQASWLKWHGSMEKFLPEKRDRVVTIETRTSILGEDSKVELEQKNPI
jgi:hypothetical protein